MKIKVIDEEKTKFFLWLPTRLVLNEVSVTLFAFSAKFAPAKYKTPLSGKALRKFVSGFYKYRKKFGGKLEIVHVETKEGDLVEVTL